MSTLFYQSDQVLYNCFDLGSSFKFRFHVNFFKVYSSVFEFRLAVGFLLLWVVFYAVSASCMAETFSCLYQDFKDGKVDTAFIPKHEDDLQAVSELWYTLNAPCDVDWNLLIWK